MNEDNDIKPDDIEEYHFTETAEQDVFATEPTRPKPSKFTRRNILLVIGAIVLLLVLYKIGSLLFGSKTTTTVPTETATQSPAISTITPPVTTGATSDQIAAIQTQTEQNKSQLDTLQNQLNTLTNSVTSMQNNLASLTAQVQALANKLEERGRVVALHPRPPIIEHHILIKKTPKPYFIQAMIPGRAWLITPTGRTITVKVGDRLFGYGTIVRIVPTRGIVLTSSGAILRYK